MTPTNIPWVEKYRPATLDDLVSHNEIRMTLTKLIAEDRLPHLLLYGPPGTGKTSLVLAIARKMFTEKQLKSQVLELNASDERGIQVVRQKIIDFAVTKGLHANPLVANSKPILKLVILDEADAMTKDAQNALRRVIEKYTETTRFCIICNYLSKLIPAVQSRCTRFRFAPLTKEQVMPRIDYIIKKEHLKVTPSGKEAIFKLSHGDMRRVINVLQSTSMAFDKQITEQAVYKCVGHPTPDVVKKAFEYLLSPTFEESFKKLSKLLRENSVALADVLDDLLSHVVKFDMPPLVAAIVMDQMAQIESRLSIGCSEKLQTLALISAFHKAREGEKFTDSLDGEPMEE